MAASAPAGPEAFTSPLGSYTVASRRALRRRRLTLATAAVLVAGALGLVAAGVATPLVNGPDGPGAAPGFAMGALDSPSPGPVANPTLTDSDAPAEPTLEPTPTPTKAARTTSADRPAAATSSPSPEPGLTPSPEPERSPVPDSVPEPDEPSRESVAAAVDAPADPTGLGSASATPSEGGETAQASDGPDRGAESADRPSGAGGWVCDGTVRLEDLHARDWSLGRATFRVRPGYEQVVLRLERVGAGAGASPSVTARTYTTSQLRRVFPGVARPTSGRATVSLLLSDGIERNLGVRGYRPSGMRVLKEFSVYPTRGGASRVLVSTASDGCFRLRVPEWSAGGRTARTARVILEVRS